MRGTIEPVSEDISVNLVAPPGAGGSWASTPTVRRVMQANKSRDTKPEMAVRRIVHSRGLRYRVNVRPEPALRRTADIVFSRARVAVFIDGCFWHGCREHHVLSKTNTDYWRAKVGRNIARDRDTDEALSRAGWAVLRFWEHENPSLAADRIVEAVAERSQPRGGPRAGVGVAVDSAFRIDVLRPGPGKVVM